jgi:ABC-2 type transport system ATP-binding protein
MTDVLKVRDLTKCYSGTPPYLAVNRISFNLKKGEILGFLGPNGSGKTTTIQMLLGTLLTSSGTIHYFDRDFFLHREEILQRVSFASTYLSLPYILTVAENLEVLGFLYGFSRKESRRRFDPLLERFGITRYRKERVSVLSAGQVTRLMMVKAFFIDPKIVLLDEPTASLDPDISRDICEFLLEQREKTGLSILFTSHKMEEVAQVCDRVIFLDKGKIIADDVPENLAKKNAFFRVRLVILEDMQKAIDIAGRAKYLCKSDHRTITVEMEEAQIAQYLQSLSGANVIYSTIQIEEPSLEDYFLKVVRESRES